MSTMNGCPHHIEARFQLERPGFRLDVDLRLPGRGVTALFGPSGSGKTTLLRCIAGLERAPHGHLSVLGEVWQDGHSWRPTHQRPLGYVFQDANLFEHLSVLDNLRYGLRRLNGADGRPWWRRGREASQEHLERAIELLGIGHLLQRRPAHLSGGERQRVGIARALALSPRLLLMDEPLAALDLTRKREILPYLERLHAELAIPVLYVSHAPDEVARLADHLVVLEQGRVLGHGSLVEMLARLDLPIRLGEDVGAVLDATVGALDPAWHLARMDFRGGHLWTRDPGLPLGRRVRVRVLARDVSLASRAHDDSSIMNTLPGVVEALADDAHPGVVLVRVRIGTQEAAPGAAPVGRPADGAVSVSLVARVTRRSAAHLGVAIGQPIWLQVKSVALLEG
ncbi:MAG: molybdenum ABC transporter ATP-binding protein [Leptothrix sp. (in: b-proteobacteria)]